MQLIHQGVGAWSALETECLGGLFAPQGRIREDLRHDGPRLAWEEEIAIFGADDTENIAAAGGSEVYGQF